MNNKILILLITIILCILFCSIHTNDYYAGIVVDELGRPIPDVIIREYFYGEIDSIHKISYLNLIITEVMKIG